MSLFFRPRKRDVPVRRYTTALIEELLASVRRQSLSLLEFNRALWGAIPTSTILLEYRGDHRVPFSIHDQVFMNEVAVQRLSRPIFKVRGVPSSINSTTLVDGFLAAITPLSTELADTRELLVPKVASPDTECLLQVALWRHLQNMLCGGPMLLAHVGLENPLHTDSGANLLFNKLSSIAAADTDALSGINEVLLTRYYEDLRGNRKLMTQSFKRACSEA